jgi:hypothetical protein
MKSEPPTARPTVTNQESHSWYEPVQVHGCIRHMTRLRSKLHLAKFEIFPMAFLSRSRRVHLAVS